MSDEPGGGPRRRIGPGLGALLLYAVASVLLTWPAVASPGEALSVRPDYVSNIWNAWWVGQALLDGTSSLYDCEVLYHPLGISLARHTLSPVNALPGALLARAVGPHDGFKILLLLHFALSGWTLFLLARELGAGWRGAFLGGLIFTFSPFHAYYLGQLNVATTEFLPLAVLFMLRTWRRGRVRDVVGLALTAGLLVGSSEYYLVYAAMLGGLLLVGGRLVERTTPYGLGARRLLGAAVASAIVVAAVAWPILSETLQLGGEGALGGKPGMEELRQERRSNDLVGFSWVGGPEEVTVSWPTMLGWTSLALLVAGIRGLRRQFFWIAAAALVLVISLGGSLQVLGRDTGVPLPYAWIFELPGMAMLRKPDRLFVIVQLIVALLCALAWDDLGRRLRPAVARWAWPAVALLVALELGPGPLSTFELQTSPYLDELAADTRPLALVDLPVHGRKTGYDAHRTYAQTVHGKPITGGYVTSLARRQEHLVVSKAWKEASRVLAEGDAQPVVRLARQSAVDLLVFHKREAVPREPLPIDGQVVWAPFRLVRADLVTMRQRGHLAEEPVAAETLAPSLEALAGAFGEALHEDEWIAVYAVPRNRR